MAAVAMGLLLLLGAASGANAIWCITQSTASQASLQAGLDYACGPGGGDCLPIQQNGLCYLPNTLQAHASYAYNSVFQRSAAAPGACDFAGTATATVTDPSYGSCTYPSSQSTAGGSASSANTSTPTNSPFIGTPTPPGLGGTSVGGLTPGFGPPVPDFDTSSAAAGAALLPLLLSGYVHLIVTAVLIASIAC